MDRFSSGISVSSLARAIQNSQEKRLDLQRTGQPSAVDITIINPTCSKSSGGKSGAQPCGNARTSAGAGKVLGEKTWSPAWCGGFRKAHLDVHCQIPPVFRKKRGAPVSVFFPLLRELLSHRRPEACTPDLCVGVYSENLDRFSEGLTSKRRWRGTVPCCSLYNKDALNVYVGTG